MEKTSDAGMEESHEMHVDEGNVKLPKTTVNGGDAADKAAVAAAMHVDEGNYKLEAPEPPKATVDGGDAAAAPAMQVDDCKKLEAPEQPKITVGGGEASPAMQVDDGKKLEAPEQPKVTVDGGDAAPAMQVDDGKKLEAPEQPKVTVDGGDATPEMQVDEGDKLEAPEEPNTTMDGGGGAEGAAPVTPVVYKKGAWSKVEDEKLRRAVEEYGVLNWTAIEKYSGLARQAKNCRLRWLNYLRPNLKKGPFTQEEERRIFHLHSKYGNSWSRIASKMPGRTDNEIKNFWYKQTRNTKVKKQEPQIPPPARTLEEQSTSSAAANDQNHTDDQKNSNDEYLPGDGSTTPTNQPSEIQLNYDPSISSSITSPQTVISTPQPQLHSPASSLSTPVQNPTNHSIQPIPSPKIPTSQPQNYLLSPRQSTVSIPTPRTAPQVPVASPKYQTGSSMPPQIPVPSPKHQTGSNMPPQIPVPSPKHQTGTSTFPTMRKPPTLSTPRERFKCLLRAKEQSSPQGEILTLSAPNVCSPAMESPRSPLKLKLSPRVPVLFSVQTTPRADTPNQTTETLAASLSAFQLKSPVAAPLSPLQFRLSIPVPSDSCFLSNFSIPDSAVQLNSSSASVSTPHSSAPAVSLSSPHLKPSDLPPTQLMPFDTRDSSFTMKTESPSIQFYAPAEPGAVNCFQEVEDENDLEIQDALREAEAKVWFLKKKLRNNRMSNQRTSPRESLSTESFLCGIPETTDLYGRGLRREAQLNRDPSQCNTNLNSRNKQLLTDSLRVNAAGKNLKTMDMLRRISRREGEQTGLLLVKSERKENSGSTQDESTETEELTHGEIKMYLAENQQGEEESWGQSLMRIVTSQEQGHSLDSFNHQIMNSNLDSWNVVPCQVPAGKCLNESSRIEDLLSESSTLLQDSFLMEELFNQTSGVESLSASQGQLHHIDVSGTIYSQSTATTPVKGGGFDNRFGLEFFDNPQRNFNEQDFMSGNLAKNSKLDSPSMLLHHQYPTTNPQDSRYTGSETMMEYGSVQRSDAGNFSAATFSFPASSSSSHQYQTASLIDSVYPVNESMFENESPNIEEYSVQTPGNGFCEGMLQSECGSSINWKQDQDPSWEQKLMAGKCHLMESKSFQEHEEEHNHMDTMPEELSSMLDFFPTNVQTPEWYNNGNCAPGMEASDEMNMDINFQVSFTSQSPISIADYI